MAPNSPSSGSIQPLSVGNVVSAAFQLYGAKFKDYVKIALWATLWILLPVLAIIATLIFFLAVRDYYALLGLLIPALIVLFVYASAKYGVNLALISRLAFGELTNTPEPLPTARRFTHSRMWSFFLAGLLVSLIFSGVFLVAYIALIIVGIALFAASGGLSALTNPGTFAANPGGIVIAGLVMLVLLIGFLLAFFWFWARFSFYEVPLAVESESTTTSTIGRSWSLSKGNAWRIVLILLIAFLVTLPFTGLAQILASIIQSAVVGAAEPQDVGILGFLAVMISSLFSLALQIIVLPLWQVIKSVIYYDLRSRREGLGLELRDRSI